MSRRNLRSRRTETYERTLWSWLPFRVLTCRPGRITDRLSWDSSRQTDLRALITCVMSGPCRPCGLRGPAKLGCRDAPPPTCLPSVHSPESTLLPTRFGPEAACLGIPFRPRGFTPPRRLPPLGRSRACCIPLPVMGFAAFPDTGFLDRPGTCTRQAPGRQECRCIPRDAVHTPRRIPLDRSRTTSPWPLPPCRSLLSRSPLPIGSVARVDPWRSA